MEEIVTYPARVTLTSLETGESVAIDGPRLTRHAPAEDPLPPSALDELIHAARALGLITSEEQ